MPESRDAWRAVVQAVEQYRISFSELQFLPM